MKTAPALLALALVASSAAAQIPRTPPAPPVPPAAPAPPATPRAPNPISDELMAHLHALQALDPEHMLRMQDAQRRTEEAIRALEQRRPEIEAAQAQAQEHLRHALEQAQMAAPRAMQHAEEGLRRAMEQIQTITPQAAQHAQEALSAAQHALHSELAQLEMHRTLTPSIHMSTGEAMAALLGTGEAAFVPRAPTFIPQDEADSAYRAAHAAMNRGEYRRAAELFKDLATKHTRSAHVGDAIYFQAFSLYRIGGQNELQQALTILESQRTVPASTPQGADVAQLQTRIRGELAARGDPRFATSLSASASRQVQCNQEDMSVKIAALNALSTLAVDSTAPLLQRIMARRDECSVTLRQQAIALLAKKHDDATAAVIIDAAKNDPSVNVRRTAVGWLATMPNERTVAALEEVLRTPRDSAMHATVIRSLASMEDPRARQSVRAYIERTDAPERLRADAISGISRSRDSVATSVYLRALYPKLESRRLKDQIISALSRYRDAETRKWLMELIRNGNEPVSQRSMALSIYSSPSTPIAEIVALYDAVQELELKRSILNVLGSRKEPEATDKLLAIARTTTADAQLRRSAISALSRKNDPRTRALLLEIIGR